MALTTQPKTPSIGSKKDARKDVESKLEALFIADKKALSDKKFKKAIKKAGKILAEALLEQPEAKAAKAAKKTPAPKRAAAKKTVAKKASPVKKTTAKQA